MSFSPKHTTSFSVTDILSPIEESYKKTTIEATIPPLVAPYRGAHLAASGACQQPGMASGMNGAMASPYHNYMSQMSHHAGAAAVAAFPPQYGAGGCTEMSPYPDPGLQARNSAAAAAAAAANWYNTSGTDPRFASEYTPPPRPRYKGTCACSTTPARALVHVTEPRGQCMPVK